ncbi:MAG: DnaB-like helicase C-terminal domain-containing protein [Candidatus Sericytochromatia bacterium]
MATIKEILKKIDTFENQFQTKVERKLIEERKLELLKHYKGEDEIVSWQDIETKVKEAGEPERLVSGLETFDKELRGGIEVGRLVVLSAGTKSGKTTISIDLMRKYQKYNPCMIVLEQPPEELIREQLFYGNEIPQIYSPKTFNKVSINWLEDRILESYLKYGTRVAVIDHLDFIEKDERQSMRHLQIQSVMEELKLMSRRLNIAIFLVAHINKLSPEEQPNHFNLAESSSIAKLSDIVLFLWRECVKVNGKIEYTGLVNLRIDISRQGGTGTDIKLIFNNGKYREADQFETMDAQQKIDNAKPKKYGKSNV